MCAALCAMIVLLAACQPTAHTHASSTTPTPPPAKFYAGFGKPLSAQEPSSYPPFVTIYFIPGTLRDQAVDLVAKLGLRSLSPCIAPERGDSSGAFWVSSNEYPALSTQPISALWVDGTGRPAGQPYYSTLSNDPLAAPDWLAQLAGAPEVREIDTGNAWGCVPMTGSETARFLEPQQSVTYAQVTFAGLSYEQAVVEVSGLGYRLSDPCYEAAHPRPAWHAMGQAGAYATTQSLVLAVTEANATQWQAQTRQLQGFVSLTVPYSTTC